jgi:hypothetical protein
MVDLELIPGRRLNVRADEPPAGPARKKTGPDWWSPALAPVVSVKGSFGTEKE